MPGIDQYALRARTAPVYIVAVPVVLLLLAVAPSSLELTWTGASALILVPLSALVAEVGGDFGRGIQPRLWASWGGSPTTALLRHGDPGLDGTTKARVHTKLRDLGLPVPTPDEEKRDPAESDRQYEACTRELVRLTRDKDKHPAVYRELISYGFRRNLLGLRKLGLGLATVAFSVAAYQVVTQPSSGPSGPAVLAMVLTAALIGVWVFWVNQAAVRIAAERYARSLLEAALSLPAGRSAAPPA